jgi:DNA-binding FrmR family transcriptional regulator
MKFWIGPLGGALATGAYGMLKLGEQWNIGGEHAFRASGTLLAYMVLGAFIGLIISGLSFVATQNEVSGSALSPEDATRLTDHTHFRRRTPARLERAVQIERSFPVSHLIGDKTKVLDRMLRIQRQIEAAQQAVQAELSWADVVRMLSDARSALNDLSAELVEDFIRMQVDPAQDSATDRAQAAQQLIEAIRSHAK